LEITDSKYIYLSSDYGQRVKTYAYVTPEVATEIKQTSFLVESDLVILIKGKSCMDSMSGAEFETTVTIKRPKQTLYGCGKTLY